ncbi:retrovirus-related pol polyprotein from transposon TNT 1-94 [Tanacetum coccineum]
MINDPLYMASSDRPGMVLTNTPFNGSNFHGWSRNVRIALGAKLKLGFIDGSCPKPDWKVIAYRYGQSNGPLVYQLGREQSKISQGSRNDGRNDEKRFCNGCNQEGHKVDQYFEKIGYHDWYKGKKAKKQNMIAANVSAGFDDHCSADIPFGMGSENEIGLNQGSGFDQKLVADVCQEMMRMFKGKGTDSSASRGYMPVKLLDRKSPFEKLYGKPPTYDHLRVIGCMCYVAVTKPHKDKFNNRGIKSVLIGYHVNQKGYK